MNILFLLHRYPLLGGVEHVTERLATELSNAGLNCHIYAQKSDSQAVSNTSESVHLGLVPDIMEKRKFIDYILSNNIDVIINQGCYPILTKLLDSAKKNAELPPIISVLHNAPNSSLHDMELSMQGKGVKPLIKRIFSKIYKRYVYSKIRRNYKKVNQLSSKIVLLSPKYIDTYREWDDSLSLDQTVVIPNFIPKVQTPALKKKKVVYVGRIDEVQKRISRIINIWERLYCKFPDWSLEIIGDGQDLDKIRASVSERKIGNVKFLGYQKDVERFLAEASLLILTSDYEGLPLSILEAMSAGCIPVVLNSFDAATDLIDNKIDGILIDKENLTEDFVSELSRLMPDESKRREMSIKSLEKASYFYPSNIIRQWLDLFTEILKR